MLNAKKGFTLSELLVSLAVLGLIAAFAVPKVLTSVGDSSFLANAKECLSVVSAAYDAVKADNITSFDPTLITLATAAAGAGTPYSIINKINYAGLGNYTVGANAAAVDTFNAVAAPAAATAAIRLGTGAIIWFNSTNRFLTVATPANPQLRSRIQFNIDPDGVGVGKPFSTFLGEDGRLFVPANPGAFTGQFTIYQAGAGTEVADMAPGGLSAQSYIKLTNAGLVTE
jgi:prepilin-type N-terminal cleavage/methylation domain-containing protein